MERNSFPNSMLQSFQSLSLSATTIDFSAEFAINRTPEEYAAAVSQYLQLHSNDKIEKLRLFFCPLDQFLPDIENWLKFAVSKGVEELNLDLSMGVDPTNDEGNSLQLPTVLFECKTLTNLSLSYCNFCPPPTFAGFVHLQSLYFTNVIITDDNFQRLIASCPSLDSLSLNTCPSLQSIIISSQRLRKLTIANLYEAYDIEISAPKLESFIYYGMHIFGDSCGWSPESKDSFLDVSSLSDAFVCAVESSEPEHDFIKLLHDLRHAKILTLCSYTLWRVRLYEDEKLPILLQNLKELQLLVGPMSTGDLACIYVFFQLCPSPFLEKLFIQRSAYPGDPDQISRVIEVAEEPSEIVFNHLKAIKLSNFKGWESEMRLVKFLLEKAVVLETLVLVAPPKLANQSMDIEQGGSVQEAAAMGMMSLHAKLNLLAKASPSANIVLCEYMEDDKTLTPTHTEYFGEY